MTGGGGNARCISSRAACAPLRDMPSVNMIESDSGSALVEYALIAALVSIVLVAVSGELYFPQAPVVALSEVAAQPRAARSTGAGATIEPRSWSGETSSARARGADYPRRAGRGDAVSITGALGSELGQGTPPVLVADGSPPSRPDPPQAAGSEADAIPQTAPPQSASPQSDEPAAAARPPEPAEGTAEENKDGTARDTGSRPTGGGNTAADSGSRRLDVRILARRPGPADEQLIVLEMGAVAEAPATADASLGGLPKDAGDRTIRKTGTLSAPRWSGGSARSAGPRGAIARDAVDTNVSWLWTLILLILAGLGLGLGPRGLRRRLILLLPFSTPAKESIEPGDTR